MSSWAVVTGASSGLGRAVALELGHRRRSVLLLGRDAARLEEAAQGVAAAGGRAEVVRGDVTDPDGLQASLDGALGAAAVDLVVHAAGVLALAPLPELDAPTLGNMLTVNVVGAANVVRVLLPRLEATRGRLAVVSSVAGLFPLPGGFSGYAASKWAVRGWAETARPELAARGVRLTVCYPSIIDTPMVHALGREAPAVYRAFAWHRPERAARALVRDVLSGRRESFITLGDRLAAACAGAFPRAFAAGLAAWVRLRG